LKASCAAGLYIFLVVMMVYFWTPTKVVYGGHRGRRNLLLALWLALTTFSLVHLRSTRRTVHVSVGMVSPSAA